MDSAALSESKRQVLRALWRTKMHVEPRALEQSAASVSASYAHIWEPATLWMQALEALPLGLLRLWESCPRGHLVFTAQESGYRAGREQWHGMTLEGVCALSLADVGGNNRRAMWATLALVDHLLGSAAAPNGGWFSEGQGVTPPVQNAASRFVALYRLGYGADELEAANAREYFAHSLELYMSLPQRLNALAPQVYWLYRRALMREAWWA